MTPDEIETLVSDRARKRSRLVRLADRAGVESAICDSGDDLTLARAYVAKIQPWVKTDTLDGPALDFAVDSCASMPAPAAPAAPRVKPRADAVDPNDPEVLFLVAQGYSR